MDCFEILGIAPTKDTKAIRKAYSAKLPLHSPENDPEGFQKLRGAYEEALKKLNEEDTKDTSLSPVEAFMGEIKEIYNDFNRRIDEKTWSDILERDICFRIDTRWEVSSRILSFFMEHYYIPNKIWVLLDNFFSWTLNKERLYREFPANYIDYVISNIKRTNSLRYDPLKSSLKQDEFIELYYKGDKAVEEYDIYTAKKSILDALDICSDHPDMLTLQGRYLSSIGKLDEAIKIISDVIKAYPDDINAYFYRGEILFKKGSIEEAYDDFKKAVDLKQDSLGSLFSLSKCCIILEKYKEALEHTKKLSDLVPYNNDIRILQSSASSFYMDLLKKFVDENPEDINKKFELAEAYHLSNRNEESLEVLMWIDQNSVMDTKMYRLYAEVLLISGKIELAFGIVSKALDLYPNDYDINHMMALVYHDMKKYNQCIPYYEKAIELKDDVALLYNNKANALNKLERYTEALECCNKALQIDPGMAHIYKNKALALFELGHFEEGLNCCETCLSYSPYLIEAIVLKMKILNRLGKYDESLFVYQKAFDIGLKNPELYLQKANALRACQRYEEALDCCNMGLEIDEKFGELYECKGFCYFYTEKYEDALKLFEHAISLDPALERSYYYSSLSYMNLSKKQEGLHILREAYKQDLKYPSKFYELEGDILFHNSEYDKAITVYKKALESDSLNPQLYFSIASSLEELKKFQESLEYFDKAIELDPGLSKAYIDKSHALYRVGNYSECIIACNKAIELDPDNMLGYQNKAWALFTTGQLDEAYKNCLKALTFEPNSENLLGLKLKILSEKNLLNDALIVADRILEINPDSQETKSVRKELLDKLNNPLSKIMNRFKGKK